MRDNLIVIYNHAVNKYHNCNYIITMRDNLIVIYNHAVNKYHNCNYIITTKSMKLNSYYIITLQRIN